MAKVSTECRGLHGDVKARYAMQLHSDVAQHRKDIQEILNRTTAILSSAHWLGKYGPQSLSSLRSAIVPCRDFKECYDQASGVNAWIFSRDSDAVQALNWAQQNNIAVPRSLSIIGLQDAPEYMPSGISTCVPDWETAGYLMAHAIIRDFPVEKTRKGFMKTHAHIMERMTTP
jgi:substrate-binding family protein